MCEECQASVFQINKSITKSNQQYIRRGVNAPYPDVVNDVLPAKGARSNQQINTQSNQQFLGRGVNAPYPDVVNDVLPMPPSERTPINELTNQQF